MQFDKDIPPQLVGFGHQCSQISLLLPSSSVILLHFHPKLAPDMEYLGTSRALIMVDGVGSSEAYSGFLMGASRNFRS